MMSNNIKLLNRRIHAPEKVQNGFLFAAPLVVGYDTVFDYIQTLEACYDNDGIALHHRNADKEIVGHGLAYRVEPDGGVIGLQAVAVHPEYRQRGIGKQLLRLLGRCSIDMLEAETLSLNPTAKARTWYEQFGFEADDIHGARLTVDAETFTNMTESMS